MNLVSWPVRRVAPVAAGMLLAVFPGSPAAGMPHENPALVPEDSLHDVIDPARQPKSEPLDVSQLRSQGGQVLRVGVQWRGKSEDFEVVALAAEPSGTAAFAAAARTPDPHGSFKARLIDAASGAVLAHDAIGTGTAFKYLARILTFRFPMPDRKVRFELVAEDSRSGAMATVLVRDLDPQSAKRSEAPAGLEVRRLRPARLSPAIVVNVYAEGYAAARKEQFFSEALKIPAVLERGAFPLFDHLEFNAVFGPSAQVLGPARNLGLPVPVRDSFLGLYFPYWYDFGRYHHVVYPTSELKYRTAIGSVPYDYAIALVDDDQYWGVGNFGELTAIPARNQRFSYLLQHEFGHFFGLNEEYESGGATELAFAPEIAEPWSQNITFQTDRNGIKWREQIQASTPLPTQAGAWLPGKIGAYPGGYAETPKPGRVFKPALACTMDAGQAFCPVCRQAIEHRIRFDMGQLGGGQSQPPGGSCGCGSDPSVPGACALIKAGVVLASTPLFGGRACDQAFCDRYFALSRRALCR